MAQTASPYGLRPVNMIGGAPTVAGTARAYKVSADTTAFYVGDIIKLSSAGLPAREASTSPVAIKIPTTSADATAGVVGVCVGIQYVAPTVNYSLWGQYLPVSATTAGYKDIWVLVNDDPNQLYQIQGSAALGSFNSGTNGSGWPGAIGKNAAISWSGSPSSVLGLSDARLVVGTNGSSLATTSTLGFRIVDVVRGTESDSYPEFIVKFNVGVHSYTNSLGV